MPSPSRTPGRQDAAATAEAIERAARTRRRRRVLAWTGIAFLALLGWLGFKLSRVPQSALDTGDPAAVAAALQGRWATIGRDSLVGAPTDVAGALETAAPPGLLEQAELWVAALNEGLPGTVLWFDADARGNLYLVLGGWLETLPDEASQVQAIKQIAAAWRQWLKDLVGPWDSRTGFSPGIVILDREGIAATDLDGTFRLYRLPAPIRPRTAP